MGCCFSKEEDEERTRLLADTESDTESFEPKRQPQPIIPTSPVATDPTPKEKPTPPPVAPKPRPRKKQQEPEEEHGQQQQKPFTNSPKKIRGRLGYGAQFPVILPAGHMNGRGLTRSGGALSASSTSDEDPTFLSQPPHPSGLTPLTSKRPRGPKGRRLPTKYT